MWSAPGWVSTQVSTKVSSTVNTHVPSIKVSTMDSTKVTNKVSSIAEVLYITVRVRTLIVLVTCKCFSAIRLQNRVPPKAFSNRY